MADTKLVDLTSGIAAATDIIYAVKDPSGTPVDRKVTISSVKDYITGAANLFTTAQTVSPLTDVAALTIRSSATPTADIFQIQDSSNAALATFDKDGKLTLGRGSGLTGVLKFANSTNANIVALQAGVSSGSVTYTLPTADGSNGQVLSTNGSGTLSWKTDANSPAGSDTQLQYNNSGAFAGASGLTTNGTNLTITSGSLTMTGNISSAAWTTNGIRYKGVAATFTDTSSSGTVAAAYTNVYGGNTIAASNSTTFTDYYTTYINGPSAGTNVTFTNQWALGLGAGLNIVQGTANKNVIKSTGYSLTGSDATSMIDLAGTWNTSGTPSAIKLNVTDTASNASSLLMDLQVGGTSKVSIDKTGAIVNRLNTYGTSNFAIRGGTSQNFGINLQANIAYFQTTSGTYVAIGGSGSAASVGINNTGTLGFHTTNPGADAIDAMITRRGAANLRLGAADAASPVAQTLSVQSVVAGTTDTAGANLTITGSQSTGTGAAGNILFQTSSAAASTATSQNALATVMTIGPNTLTGSQATNLLSLAQTWNTSGTPTALLLNVTDTASNTASLFMDFQIGGTSRFAFLKGNNTNATQSGIRLGTSASGTVLLAGAGALFVKSSDDSAYRTINCGTVGLGGDAFLGYRTTNSIYLGLNNTTATPATQTLGVNNASGTNVAGADFVITGSRSTGTGAGGNLVQQTSPSAKSTGSTQNSLVTRDVIVAKGKVLTDATATSLFEIALPTLTTTGGKITATTICTDGTDVQTITEIVTFAAVNKGGVYTTDIDVGTTSSALSGGSLANTWTVLTGTNKITIQLSSDTSLTPSANSFLVYYTVTNNSEQAVTIL